jgi:hypothetical protein
MFLDKMANKSNKLKWLRIFLIFNFFFEFGTNYAFQFSKIPKGGGVKTLKMKMVNG